MSGLENPAAAERRQISRLGEVVLLLRQDARFLLPGFALWLLVLLKMGWPGWSWLAQPDPQVSSHFAPFRDLGFLAGTVFAGWITLQHPLSRGAFWRTRPWRRSSLLVAKMVEVLGLVVLPAMLLQLMLLSRIEVVEPQWGLWSLELLIAVGGPFLLAAALGVLGASFPIFVLAGIGLLLFNGWILSPLGIWLWRPVRGLVYCLILGTMILLLAYLGGQRRRALIAAMIFTCAIWIPGMKLDSDALSRWLGTLPYQAEASVSDRKSSFFREMASLCVDLEVEGIPEETDARVELHGRLRGVNLDIAKPNRSHGSSTTPLVSGYNDSTGHAMTSVDFAYKSVEELRPFLDRTVDLTLEIELRLTHPGETLPGGRLAERSQTAWDGGSFEVLDAEADGGLHLTSRRGRFSSLLWSSRQGSPDFAGLGRIEGSGGSDRTGGGSYAPLPFSRAQFYRVDEGAGWYEIVEDAKPAYPRAVVPDDELSRRLETATWTMRTWAWKKHVMYVELEDVLLRDLVCSALEPRP